MNRSNDIGDVSVSGPGCDRDGLPSVGAAISLATTRAFAHTGDGTWYVREDGATKVVVERHGKQLLIHPAVRVKGAVADVVSL